MHSFPSIRACILVTLAYSAHAHAAEASDPCLSEQAKTLSHIGCTQAPLTYHENGQEKKGQLLTFDTAKGMEHYVLISPEGHWKDLKNSRMDAPADTLPCAFRSLYFGQNRFGTPQEYASDDFGTYQWQIKNNALAGVLTGQFPFKGTIHNIGTNCRGALRYERGIRTWQQAETLCRQAFRDAQETRSSPQVQEMMFSHDAAGPYYLCMVGDNGQERSPMPVTHYYRIALEETVTPGITLVRAAR